MATKKRTYNDTHDFVYSPSDSICEECLYAGAVQNKEGIISIQQIMQNQNQFLKSMLLQLLEELKKSASDKELQHPEEDKSTEATNRELRKLRKENKKMKETLLQKQANLAKCLTVLESNNSDIGNLSKHIESLCFERDKYRDEIKKMQCIISKVGTANTEKNELSKELEALKDQLEICKTQLCNNEKTYHKEIEDLKEEAAKFKELYREIKENKELGSKLDELKQLTAKCTECSNGSVDLCALIQKLKYLEKELEASNLELSEYEEENRCYCQRIEALLQTVKCLQEAKLRSEEDSAEYCERFNKMRAEFQEMCEEKNKIIKDLDQKLEETAGTENRVMDTILEKDHQIKKLQEQLAQLNNEHKECKLMENKYQDCQLQFEFYFKQLKALQSILNETHCKLDICDKTIKDLQNRNKSLEEKIVDLECSLDNKISGIGNWDVMLKELQCVNLKLQQELRNKDSIISNLENCLDQSNQILASCAREMASVEQRSQKFKSEMNFIKSKLEGELLQNQCLAIKCNLLKDDNCKCGEGYNTDEDVKNLRSQYKILLEEAAAKENELEYIKSEIIEIFDKEAEELSKLKKTSRSSLFPSEISAPHRETKPQCSCRSNNEDSGLVKLPKSVQSWVQYHKDQKYELRMVRSDSNLRRITIKVFNTPTAACCTKHACKCKCMTVITRRYKQGKLDTKCYPCQ